MASADPSHDVGDLVLQLATRHGPEHCNGGTLQLCYLQNLRIIQSLGISVRCFPPNAVSLADVLFADLLAAHGGLCHQGMEDSAAARNDGDDQRIASWIKMVQPLCHHLCQQLLSILPACEHTSTLCDLITRIACFHMHMQSDTACIAPTTAPFSQPIHQLLLSCISSSDTVRLWALNTIADIAHLLYRESPSHACTSKHVMCVTVTGSAAHTLSDTLALSSQSERLTRMREEMQNACLQALSAAYDDNDLPIGQAAYKALNAVISCSDSKHAPARKAIDRTQHEQSEEHSGGICPPNNSIDPVIESSGDFVKQCEDLVDDVIDRLFMDGSHTQLDLCVSHISSHLTARHFSLIPSLHTKLLLSLSTAPTLFSPLLLRLYCDSLLSHSQFVTRLCPFLTTLLTHSDTIRVQNAIMLAVWSDQSEGLNASRTHSNANGDANSDGGLKQLEEQQDVSKLWQNGSMFGEYEQLSAEQRREVMVQLGLCLRHSPKRFWPRLTSCVSFLFAYYSAPFRSSSLADQSSSCPCRRHVGSQASCPEVDLLLEVWMSTLASGDPTLHISDSASISSSSSSLSCSTSSSSTSSFSSSSSHAHPSCTATQHPSFSPSPFSPSSSSHSSSSSSSLSFLPAVTSLSRLSIHMFIAVQLPQGFWDHHASLFSKVVEALLCCVPAVQSLDLIVADMLLSCSPQLMLSTYTSLLSHMDSVLPHDVRGVIDERVARIRTLCNGQ